jgi:hypothetical protein
LVHLITAVGEIIVIAQLNSIWEQLSFFLYSSHLALSPYLEDYFRKHKYISKLHLIIIKKLNINHIINQRFKFFDDKIKRD